MKNVLVIAYYFPPTGGGGVQRAAKFVKYLPSFGWRPVVLTVKNPDFDVFDESLIDDIPFGVKVFKVYSFDPVRWYRTRRYGPNSLFDRKGKGISPNNRKSSSHVFSLITNTVKYFLKSFVLIPDDYVGWIPFAVIKGYIIIKKEKIDVVYATGKPWSSFLIAFFLSLLTGKPYVLDLRDPWELTPYDDDGANRIRRKLNKFWEKTCFSSAMKVININEQISRAYVQHYPSIPSAKFTYITHGYDSDDFVNVTEERNNDRLTISYVGTIYSYTLPNRFLMAVSSIVSKNPEIGNNLRVKFVGFVPSYVRQLIRELSIERIVEIIGYLPHKESIRHMISSDVLLLLLNKVYTKANAQVSTGKLFEYLASRRPILALVPFNTDASKLIKELGAGRVIEPDDVKGIADAIFGMYIKQQKGELRSHSSDISRFDRANLTGQLTCILDVIQAK